MKTLARNLTTAAVAAFLTAPLHAIQDSNGNGLSDIWEKFYNNDNPFPLSSPYLAGDDPDADGWTNEDEAVAGTDPFNAVLPEGWVRTTIQDHPEVDGCFMLSWPSIEGKGYQLSVSTNLVEWADCGDVMAGTGAAIALALDCEYEEGGTPERMFWRVRIEDVDPDGDNLTTWEELALGTDPNHPDSDLDGIFDGADNQPLASATVADPDGLGLPASLEDGLIGRWDFEQIIDQGGVQMFPDLAGGDHPFTSSTPGGLWLRNMSMISKGARLYDVGDYLEGPASLVGNRSAFSLSFWVRAERDFLSDFWPTAVIFAYSQSQTATPEFLLTVESGTNFGDPQNLVFRHIDGSPQPDWTLPLPAGFQFDSGRWQQLVLVKKPASLEIHLNGSLLGSLNTSVVWGADPTAYLSLGNTAIDGTDPGNALWGAFDRTRFYDRPLTAGEIDALYHQDSDGDGLWDLTEVNTSLWIDLNWDFLPDPGEWSYAVSPFEWQFPDTDSDGDGVADLTEQAIGTAIDRTDSDGDLLPDGWEIGHGLDGTVPDATDVNANGVLDSAEYPDTDGDGLTTLDEYRFNTNPNLADTDGDGVDDGDETDGGADPNDPDDGGQPPDPEEMQEILLGIGDESGSESEDYVLQCYRLDPESGAETRVYTLRSGGHGKYHEETVANVFRKGVTYTFQIEWQGSSITRSGAGSGEPSGGPDFDYTFRVEPQNLPSGQPPDGILVDAWDPVTATVDPLAGLLGKVFDVAENPEDFQREYVRKRVVFLPLSLHSNDRMLGGTFDLLPGFEGLELTISNETTGQSFGTYGYLDGSGDTLVYTSVYDIFGIEDNFGADISDPSVWFLGDPALPSRREFYLVSGEPDGAYGTVKVEARLGGALLGTLRHSLAANPVFGAAIDAVTGWAGGEGFDMGGPAVSLPQAPQWAAPVLIPLYTTGHQVEGISLIIEGIGEGVKSGLQDDWEFIVLIGQGAVLAGDFAHQAAQAEITKWRQDPLARFVELHAIVHRTMEDQVFEPLGAVAQDLSTIEGFKRRFLQAAIKGHQLSVNLWGTTVEGLEEWFDDFANRMADEAEANAWLETPLSTNALLAEGTALFREQCHTTGYVFGYICEQVAIGALSAGTVKVAQVAAKGGVALAAQLAKRAAATVAVRLHWYKKILADSGLQDALIRAAYERGFVLCAVEPAQASVKKPAFEILESLFTREGFDRASYNFRRYLDDIEGFANLRKATLSQGGEALISRRAAQLAHILGDDCDAVIMKNFMRIANDQICVLRPDGSVDNYFEAFFRAFNGNPALMTSADDATFTISSLNANGKATLKKFLSDPNSGKLWEIDVPAIVDNEPAVPHNYWIRGILGELDIYKRVYKPAGYTHAPTAAGYDFTGPKWVQIKTLKNPNGATGAMATAIDDLVAHSPGAPTPLKLHILKKPGTDSSGLDAALRQYLEDHSLNDRIELLIESYELAP